VQALRGGLGNLLLQVRVETATEGSFAITALLKLSIPSGSKARTVAPSRSSFLNDIDGRALPNVVSLGLEGETEDGDGLSGRRPLP
jgi:hypothetical protein